MAPEIILLQIVLVLQILVMRAPGELVVKTILDSVCHRCASIVNVASFPTTIARAARVMGKDTASQHEVIVQHGLDLISLTTVRSRTISLVRLVLLQVTTASPKALCVPLNLRTTPFPWVVVASHPSHLRAPTTPTTVVGPTETISARLKSCFHFRASWTKNTSIIILLRTLAATRIRKRHTVHSAKSV